MKPLFLNLSLALVYSSMALQTCAQGTFQNLDFESGVFIPIPDDPYGRVEFSPAMPGWTGYAGTNQIEWILYDNMFLSTAGIAIWGPGNPNGDFMQGHYHVLLQRGDNPFGATGDIVSSSIAQTAQVPATAQSILFDTRASFASIALLFGGQPIPSSLLGQSDGIYFWGADISARAGQTGELRFLGNGFLDNIRFSAEPIPEPSTLGFFAFGTLLLGWRFLWKRKH